MTKNNSLVEYYNLFKAQQFNLLKVQALLSEFEQWCLVGHGSSKAVVMLDSLEESGQVNNIDESDYRKLLNLLLLLQPDYFTLCPKGYKELWKRYFVPPVPQSLELSSRQRWLKLSLCAFSGLLNATPTTDLEANFEWLQENLENWWNQDLSHLNDLELKCLTSLPERIANATRGNIPDFFLEE